MEKFEKKIELGENIVSCITQLIEQCYFPDSVVKITVIHEKIPIAELTLVPVKNKDC